MQQVFFLKKKLNKNKIKKCFFLKKKKGENINDTESLYIYIAIGVAAFVLCCCGLIIAAVLLKRRRSHDDSNTVNANLSSGRSQIYGQAPTLTETVTASHEYQSSANLAAVAQNNTYQQPVRVTSNVYEACDAPFPNDNSVEYSKLGPSPVNYSSLSPTIEYSQLGETKPLYDTVAQLDETKPLYDTVSHLNDE